MNHPVTTDSRGKISGPGAPRGIIARYLASRIGRQKLAMSMVSPLRTRLDYSGIGRKAFIVDQLPCGTLPTYDTSIDVGDKIITLFKHNKVMTDSRGQIRRVLPGIKGRRVVIPTFQVFANPTIKLKDIKTRRFNLIDSIQETKNHLMGPEDSSIFEALGKIGKIEE